MNPADDIGIVDLLTSLPSQTGGQWRTRFRHLMMDEPGEDFTHPAGYMFHNQEAFQGDDPVGALIADMDANGVDRVLISWSEDDPDTTRAMTEHPTRIFGSYMVDPNRGMEELRALERAVKEFGIRAAAFFPCGCFPRQVPINDKMAFPFYAKCIELDVPICVNAGVPGPRFLAAPQEVARIDEVCWYFPELKFVTRHGCEPWTGMAVKLLLKYPNLYYSTSAFAPKHYPADVVAFANTRGAAKVMFAGYHNDGLQWQRVIPEFAQVGFRDHVWPGFLRENALRVFDLEPR
jgi:predicted TIM-barrel fold metal-dependent hydrolase